MKQTEQMEEQKVDQSFRWKKTLFLGFIDVITVAAAYFFALYLRFDFQFANIPQMYLNEYIRTIIPWLAVTIVVFSFNKLYLSILTLASVSELLSIIKAYLCLLPAYGLLIVVMKIDLPRSCYAMGYVLSFCLSTAVRFSYRMLRFISHHDFPLLSDNKKSEDRIMLVGAGAAGQVLLKELQESDKISRPTKVCCIVDDNPYKWGRYLEGIKIVGGRQDIIANVKKYKINRIVLAIPTLSGTDQKELLDICKLTGCKLQTVPGMYQLVNGEVSVSRLRDVDITDLLGREQVRVNNTEIFADIFGKTILVTGGGGSIGSELCRQIAGARPRQLIIFDIYENNAYAIQQELTREYPELDLVTLIGSVRNTKRIESVMAKYKPDIVFHAAAHKHVPLMEDSPNEAIKNNVIGTYKTAQAAAQNDV